MGRLVFLRCGWSGPCGPDDVIDLAAELFGGSLEDGFDVVELRVEVANVADYVVDDVVS